MPSPRTKPSPVAPALSQSVTETLQTLSHEIRTPLNAIIGFSELIELGAWGPINDDYKDCLRRIQAAGHHLNEFVGEILEDARLRRDTEAPKLRSVIVAQLIRTAIEAVNRHATVRAIKVVAAENALETITVTEPQIMERCIVRLIRCAIAETTDGSVITVATCNKPDGSIDITILPSALTRRDTKSLSYGIDPLNADPATALQSLRFAQIQTLASRINATVDTTPMGFTLKLPAADASRDSEGPTPALRTLAQLMASGLNR
nr:histidine kinase dimerization/phospho-acceptor domain-containing protein [Govania unica]